MHENNVVELKTQRDEGSKDFLTEVLRSGAQKLLANAIEAEVNEFLSQHQKPLADGRQQYVRNGYLSERDLST